VAQRIERLSDRDPVWLPDPREPGGRWGVGISFLCPVHHDHRCFLYFRKPLDGGPAITLTRLYDVDHVDLTTMEIGDDISVYPIGDDTSPITPGCGARFWLVGGSLVVHYSKWWHIP
jgi:hypothetical protein